MTDRETQEPTLDSDPIEFVRRNWERTGQRRPEQFAAAVSILRLHELVSAEFIRVLRPFGLNRTAYHVLSALLMSDDNTRPLGQLGKALMVHPATLTLVVDQLEKRNLLHRSPHPTSRRTTLAILTPAGIRMVTEASAALADANFGLASTTDETARRLNDSLRRVRKPLGDAVE
ncbi:MAG: MarR family transcriptional regulator [Nocardia sp.]|uniref:MarR family winged helix-turn-helix transcriptional regulator n=1 Tax=Nocardia sp. TaxID=1821 RepID=UPI00260754AA|nr:MarR family transcriptional regulator [Nocardia sp.]MCU1647644.1 MarR family transcriptional regulator [Nocardia sp.]